MKNLLIMLALILCFGCGKDGETVYKDIKIIVYEEKEIEPYQCSTEIPELLSEIQVGGNLYLHNEDIQDLFKKGFSFSEDGIKYYIFQERNQETSTLCYNDFVGIDIYGNIAFFGPMILNEDIEQESSLTKISSLSIGTNVYNYYDFSELENIFDHCNCNYYDCYASTTLSNYQGGVTTGGVTTWVLHWGNDGVITKNKVEIQF